MPYFALQDMTKLYYEEQGKGQPVLMVHGWSGSHESMADVVDILSVPLLGVVPDDANVVISSNQGEPLVGEDSPAGKAYANIVRRILGEEIPISELERRISFWTKVTGIFQKA